MKIIAVSLAVLACFLRDVNAKRFIDFEKTSPKFRRLQRPVPYIIWAQQNGLYDRPPMGGGMPPMGGDMPPMDGPPPMRRRMLKKKKQGRR